MLILIADFVAPLIAPYDPIAQQDIVRTGFLPPSLEHPLGTDRFGRDVLSRIIYGARVSLSIAFVAVAIAITIGTIQSRSRMVAAGILVIMLAAAMSASDR